MSDDKKPRITSFAFSKEFFNDPTFSAFLFENKDLMNLDFDKIDSNSGNSQGSDQNPTNSSSESQTIFGSHRRYSNKNGVTTYHLNSPLSSPENNHINNTEPSIETSETANYYNIINAIKKENINKNNNNQNAGIFNPTSSFGSSPPPTSSFGNTSPISPLPYNINNQKFYKNTQQSYSAFELNNPDHLADDQKSTKSVKEYSTNAPYTKRRSKSLHNVNPNYDDESFDVDYINDSVTEYSFTQQKDEPFETTSTSEKKGHSRSLSKTLKRAVSRNSRKSKKSHRKEFPFPLKSKDNKVPEVPPIPQEFNDNTLVFKPASGAIASYGDVTNDDNKFDFDSMISSDKTRKISLTPNRMNEIQKHQQSSSNRLKPKSHERENLVPMNVMNNNIGRKNNNFDNVNLNIMDESDSDDSIDRLLNEGKPKRKQETLWEFLKNSSPEDFMGKSKADKLTGNSSTTPAKPAKPANNGPQPKYIPIEIKYSPFDSMDNKNNKTDNGNGLNYNSVNSNNLNFNSVNNNNLNYNNMNYNNAKYVQTLPYHKKSLNYNNTSSFSSATLPLNKRSTSRKLSEGAVSPSVQSMKIAHSISNIAQTSESSDDDYSNSSLQPSTTQTQEQQSTAPPKPEMVSVGTQWYISDASLMRKKKVLFRPVDRRNPIAKYMFNHAFIETIYVSNEDIKKRRAHIQEVVPQDFLARNFYYYSRYPSAVPPMPKPEMVSKSTGTETETETNDKVTMEPEVINHSVEVINDYIDENDSINNEDKTEINDEATLTTNAKKTETKEREIQPLYTQQERNEIVNTLFNKIVQYLEANPEKQKENNNKTQEFAKLMFKENTKLQKELTKLRSELSAERVLRETAEEELTRYRTLMQSTLLNDN